MADPVKEVLDAWASRHGLAFVWIPDGEIAYTCSRGTWEATTPAGDRISVHPGPPIELELLVIAGHVEVERLTLEELRQRFDGVLEWFDSWTSFFSQGPGQGH